MTGKSTKRFNFDTVFDARGNVLESGSAQGNLSAPEIEQQLAEAYDRGRQDQVVLEQQAIERAVNAFSEQISTLLTSINESCADTSKQAVSLALIIGKKLAGAALARYEIDQVKWLVQKTLSEIKGNPKVKIRVTDTVAQQIQLELDSLGETASFGGKLHMEIDEQADPGQVGISWAEGSVSVDPVEIEARIEQDITNWFTAANNSAEPNNQSIDEGNRDV